MRNELPTPPVSLGQQRLTRRSLVGAGLGAAVSLLFFSSDRGRSSQPNRTAQKRTTAPTPDIPGPNAEVMQLLTSKEPLPEKGILVDCIDTANTHHLLYFSPNNDTSNINLNKKTQNHVIYEIPNFPGMSREAYATNEGVYVRYKDAHTGDVVGIFNPYVQQQKSLDGHLGWGDMNHAINGAFFFEEKYFHAHREVIQQQKEPEQLGVPGYDTPPPVFKVPQQDIELTDLESRYYEWRQDPTDQEKITRQKFELLTFNYFNAESGNVVVEVDGAGLPYPKRNGYNIDDQRQFTLVGMQHNIQTLVPWSDLFVY